MMNILQNYMYLNPEKETFNLQLLETTNNLNNQIKQAVHNFTKI